MDNSADIIADLNEVKACIDQAERICIFNHVSPDGDAIGSALGLGWALEHSGKSVQFVSQDGVPDEFLFIFKEFGVNNPFVESPGDYDCSILVDISSLDRAGDHWYPQTERIPDICIDHHVSNPGIGRLNIVEKKGPAAAAIVAELLPKLGLPISPDVASALLMGILTDTNGFSTSNMNSNVLRTAAGLVDAGANIYRLSEAVIREHSFAGELLWGRGLSRLQIRDRLAWTYLTMADREESGYNGMDDADLIDHLSGIKEADAVMVFIESKPDEIKLSWRSRPSVDVSAIAATFGGGGHKAASGATVTGKTLNEVMAEGVATTLKMMEQGNNA